jgi:hypothetical protein
MSQRILSPVLTLLAMCAISVRAMQEQVLYLVGTLKEKLAQPFYLNGGGWRTEVDWLVMVVREILRSALGAPLLPLLSCPPPSPPGRG